MSKKSKKLFKYTRCGLNNVYLLNGFHEENTKYGKSVSVEDVDGLHKVIATVLVERKPNLTGPEFRFLRKQLKMSQTRLATIMGFDCQTIARWEKQGRVLKHGDHLMRMIYSTYNDENPRVVQLIDKLNEFDRLAHKEKLAFKNTDEIWQSEVTKIAA